MIVRTGGGVSDREKGGGIEKEREGACLFKLFVSRLRQSADRLQRIIRNRSRKARRGREEEREGVSLGELEEGKEKGGEG